MRGKMRIFLAQINPVVGDIKQNSHKIIRVLEKARGEKAQIVVFPELAITGYPPKDLLFRKEFVEKNMKALKSIILETKNLGVIVGFVHKENGNLYNAAAVIENRKLLGIQHKIHLPEYDVFDEKRYFSAGKKTEIWKIKGSAIGVSICEDIWQEPTPLQDQSRMGAKFFINISASPFHAGKWKERKLLLQKRAAQTGKNLIYVNMVGGQDDIIFDGRSCVIDKNGKVTFIASAFHEDLCMVSDAGKECKELDEPEEIWQALALGVSDYAHKNGFSSAVVGISGGIDSAVTASIACQALGKKNVLGVFMPSPFTSSQSRTDAHRLALNLGIKLKEIPIGDTYLAYKKMLGLYEPHVALENVQARIRGNILMALSNKEGHLVLSTGNKSELSVGYCTLYGDLSGGYSVLCDVPKTMVYKLAAYANNKKKMIPQAIINREPTAELRLTQKDTDSLPPYDVLDPILKLYIEEHKSVQEIITQGFSLSIVRRVLRMVDAAEYKRKQMPPGPKVTSKAFGTGRRMPITNNYISTL